MFFEKYNQNLEKTWNKEEKSYIDENLFVHTWKRKISSSKWMQNPLQQSKKMWKGCCRMSQSDICIVPKKCKIDVAQCCKKCCESILEGHGT
jgi:hypothetical protein